MNTLLDLLSHDTDLHRVASTNGGEYAGPCPFCGGKDRFRVWPESGRYWCRQCGGKGDAIQYLRDRDGLSFAEAKRALGLDISTPPWTEIVRRKAHKTAMETARSAYETWQFWRLQELADKHIELLADRDVAENAHRAMYIRPEWLSDSEQEWWKGELKRIYDRLPVVGYLLDLLTFKENEKIIFQWWTEEEAVEGN